jgi:Fic-DOC domain mobile mystery protein B
MTPAGGEPNGATLLGEDDAEGLIPALITTRSQLNELEAENIRGATRWAVKFRPRRNLLSDTFIRELHRRMFGAVWEWAGAYRTSDTDIGVHWATVPSATREFGNDVQSWVSAGDWSAGEIAVRLHHRLVQIHPFPNGNGRHARLLADLYLREKEAPLRWTGGIADPAEARLHYLAALRLADAGRFNSLLRFCGVKK